MSDDGCSEVEQWDVPLMQRIIDEGLSRPRQSKPPGPMFASVGLHDPEVVGARQLPEGVTVSLGRRAEEWNVVDVTLFFTGEPDPRHFVADLVFELEKLVPGFAGRVLSELRLRGAEHSRTVE